MLATHTHTHTHTQHTAPLLNREKQSYRINTSEPQRKAAVNRYERTMTTSYVMMTLAKLCSTICRHDKISTYAFDLHMIH